MKQPFNVYALTVVFVLAVSAGPPVAQANGFSITPASCVPTSGTLQAKNFIIGSDGSITLKSGLSTSTEIRMNCPIPSISAPTSLTAVYSRTGGTLSLSYIAVDSSGQETFIAGLTGNNSSGTRQSQSSSFSDAHSAYTYFVEIDFVAISSNNLVVYGIEVH